MQGTPKGLRLHIGIFGRRNVGKSSLLNALTRQSVSLVSAIAGTTTDPVEKPMEWLPFGPVLFIDTAGIDDLGSLGELRIQKTRQIFDRVDLALLVAECPIWGPFEERLLEEFQSRQIPVIVVWNKRDLAPPPAEILETLQDKKIPWCETSAERQEGILSVRERILEQAPEGFFATSLVGDLLSPGDLAILVVPIDLEAPKGRLILPQVQTLRDILNHDAYAMVVKERELRDALLRLTRPPRIVITDSQAFLKVAGDTPDSILLTSFSILLARSKGDLAVFVEGALAIESLRPGSRILIAEACSHHPIADDIGRVKIPRWLRQYVGGNLEITTVQGHDFPADLTDYQLVVHCGACMLNRREMLSRILRCRAAGVPITNYGLAIAYSLGIFERALTPFPDALHLYHQHRCRHHPPPRY